MPQNFANSRNDNEELSQSFLSQQSECILIETLQRRGAREREGEVEKERAAWKQARVV